VSKLAMSRSISLLAVVALALLTSLASAAIPSTADDWRGTWNGVYACSQGVTGLTLTITPDGDDKVTATFSFYAVKENPSVPSGEFTMFGRLQSRAGHLALMPMLWTTRPPFYVTVGLDGDYDPVSGEYHGQVHGPGCGLFHLRRDVVS
jgi:hypothetical protein